MSSDRIVRRLDALLKSQAQYLKTGNISGALAIAPGIEKLIDKMEAQETPQKASARSMAILREQALKNADLITAAREGIEAAREIITQIDQEPGFQSYDADGNARRIGSGG